MCSKKLLQCFTLAIVVASSFEVSAAEVDTDQVITSEQVQWGYLNPLRGDASPAAADLWGDRTRDRASGVLVKFKDGFSSPPHIHNITYRGIVIKGQVHNDDPDAAMFWLPSGSFWTQPAGKNHITAAQGEENLIYLEIERGPYLVKPAEQGFDNGEQPLNLHAANRIWLSSEQTNLLTGEALEISYLWQNTTTGEHGLLVKIPARTTVAIESAKILSRAVVISGKIELIDPKATQELNPGSYFSTTDNHKKLTAKTDVTLYIRSTPELRMRALK